MLHWHVHDTMGFFGQLCPLRYRGWLKEVPGIGTRKTRPPHLLQTKQLHHYWLWTRDVLRIWWVKKYPLINFREYIVSDENTWWGHACPSQTAQQVFLPHPFLPKSQQSRRLGSQQGDETWELAATFWFPVTWRAGLGPHDLSHDHLGFYNSVTLIFFFALWQRLAVIWYN